MVDLPRRIAAEKENVRRALDNLRDAMDRDARSTVELAAIATFLHNVYNGIENILKQMLKAEGVEIPRSETSHKDLLNLALSSDMITEKLCDRLYEYLTFRHFFVHAYGFMLEEKHLDDLANGITDVWLEFLATIESQADMG